MKRLACTALLPLMKHSLSVMTLYGIVTAFGIDALCGISVHAESTKDLRALYQKGAALLDALQGNPSQILEAYQYFQEILHQDANSPYGHLGMSRMYRTKACGDKECDPMILRKHALPLALQAEALGPEILEVRTNLVNIYRLLGEFRKAEEEVQEALRIAPDQALPYLVFGYLLEKQGKYQEAVARYEEALLRQATPEIRAGAFEALGELFRTKLRNPAKAVEYFKQAIAAHENAPWTYNNLGLVYEDLGQYDFAVASFTRALELMPFKVAQHNLLRVRGRLAEQKGELEEAIRLYEQALLLLPDNFTLHNMVAVAYTKRGGLQQAHRHLEQAIQLNPRYAQGYANLAMMMERLNNDYHAQLKYAQEAIRLDPQYAPGYLEAGRACQAMGRMDEAFAYYQKYMERDPEGDAAIWLRKKFPQLHRSHEPDAGKSGNAVKDNWGR